MWQNNRLVHHLERILSNLKLPLSLRTSETRMKQLFFLLWLSGHTFVLINTVNYDVKNNQWYWIYLFRWNDTRFMKIFFLSLRTFEHTCLNFSRFYKSSETMSDRTFAQDGFGEHTGSETRSSTEARRRESERQGSKHGMEREANTVVEGQTAQASNFWVVVGQSTSLKLDGHEQSWTKSSRSIEYRVLFNYQKIKYKNNVGIWRFEFIPRIRDGEDKAQTFSLFRVSLWRFHDPRGTQIEWDLNSAELPKPLESGLLSISSMPSPRGSIPN